MYICAYDEIHENLSSAETTLLVSRYAKTAVLSFFRATAPQNHAITLNNPFSSSPFSCAPACERARIGVPPRRPT